MNVSPFSPLDKYGAAGAGAAVLSAEEGVEYSVRLARNQSQVDLGRMRVRQSIVDGSANGK